MKHLLIFLVLITTACQAETDNAVDADAAATSDAAFVVSMEGTTHVADVINQVNSTVKEEEGELRFYLTQDETPMSLNLNIKQFAIPTEFPAVFTLPADNNDKIRIDLNFFNKGRSEKRMRWRVLFDEGTIEFQALSASELKMTFKGSGHPLMDKERFPIEGSINVSF